MPEDIYYALQIMFSTICVAPPKTAITDNCPAFVLPSKPHMADVTAALILVRFSLYLACVYAARL